MVAESVARPAAKAETEAGAEAGAKAKAGAAAAAAARRPLLRARTAWRRIVAAGCAELGREAASDADSVHRRRVAIRRLRSVLALFAPCLDKVERRRYDVALRELGRAYGPVRDWDVACLRSFPAAMEGEEAAAAAALLAASDAARHAARAVLAASGAAAECADLAGDIASWAAGPTVLDPAVRFRPIATIGPVLLCRLDRRARRRGRGIDRLSAKELHALRRALKRANYAAEALEGVAPGLALGAFCTTAEAALDQLGRFNDAGVARGLADALASRDALGTEDAAGQVATPVRRWAKRRARKARRRLEPAWKAFRAAPRPWA